TGGCVGNDPLRRRRAEKAMQAAAREPVGREYALLERHQRVKVGALGLANADFGERRMSKTGGHRADSDDISFAIRPHRGAYLSPHWSLGPLNPFDASRDEPGRAAASAAKRKSPISRRRFRLRSEEL